MGTHYVIEKWITSAHADPEFRVIRVTSNGLFRKKTRTPVGVRRDKDAAERLVKAVAQYPQRRSVWHYDAEGDPPPLDW